MKISKKQTKQIVSDDTVVPADVDQTVEPCQNEAGFIALMTRMVLRNILSDTKL